MMPINSCFMFTTLPRWRAGSKPFPRGGVGRAGFRKMSLTHLIPASPSLGNTNLVCQFFKVTLPKLTFPDNMDVPALFLQLSSNLYVSEDIRTKFFLPKHSI
jgi:hypothetical protein